MASIVVGERTATAHSALQRERVLTKTRSPSDGEGDWKVQKMFLFAASAEAIVRPAVVRGAPGASLRRSHAVMVEDDSNPFLAAINGLQEAMQESPVATLKKGFAKLQVSRATALPPAAALRGRA